MAASVSLHRTAEGTHIARGAGGDKTLQGSIFGLENPIDARGEPGGVERRGASTLAGKNAEFSASGMLQASAESRLRARGRWTIPGKLHVRAQAHRYCRARGTGV